LDVDALQRIHIVGGPGGGKTTLAGRLAELTGAPVLDLDGQALRHIASMSRPYDFEALLLLREAEIADFVAQVTWIGEGAFIGEQRLLLELADLVVWIDVPWSVASRRILLRHVKASLARNNRFPGLGNLYTFWRWCSRYYKGSNPHGLNVWRSPNTRATLDECLRPHQHKLVVCHSNADIDRLVQRVTSGLPASVK
jgi:adenylate kinase family enzyme